MAFRSRSVLVAAMLALAAAAPLQAQRGIEVNALYGYYRPTGEFDPSGTVASGLPVRPQDLGGVALGGEARLWLGPRWGVQVQGTTTTSTTPDVVTPGGCCLGAPVRVSTFAARAAYNLLPDSRDARLWLGAGPALVRHGGKGYADFGSPVYLAGSAGAGVSVRLPGSGVRVSAGSAALLYHYMVYSPVDWGLPTRETVQSGWRRDLLLHVGLGWGLP